MQNGERLVDGDIRARFACSADNARFSTFSVEQFLVCAGAQFAPGSNIWCTVYPRLKYLVLSLHPGQIFGAQFTPGGVN